MLNQKHSTVLATREKINSIAAETMTEKRQSFLELSRGKGHYFYVLAKLCLMQPQMSLAFFPARLHCWIMISLFCSSFAFPEKLLSNGHPQAYVAPHRRDIFFLLNFKFPSPCFSSLLRSKGTHFILHR